MLSTALFTSCLCVLCSIVASTTSYFVPVSAALIFGILHFLCAFAFLKRVRSDIKWALPIVSIPVAVFSIDNLGRLISITGFHGFRILI